MKTIGKTGFALLALLVASTGWGQGVFLKYGPQPGIQFSTGLDYHNTAATAANVVSLWSGTCTVGNFLQGNGVCAAPTATPPAGSTTQVQFNNAGAFGASADFTWTDSTKTLQLNTTNSTSSIIKPGANAAGAGRAIAIQGGSSTGGNGIGGGVSLSAGFGNGSGQGGNVNITAGDSGTVGTNTAGSVIITGGRGQTPGPAFGGPVTITGGTVLADGNGGEVDITGSPGVGTNRSGGGVVVTLGAATGSGVPGIMSILGGSGAVVGAPTGGAKGVGTLNAVGLYVGGVAVGTGGGSPGGTTTQLQYNNAGVFGGSAGLTWDNSLNKLNLSVASAGGDYINLSSTNTSFIGISLAVSTGHTYAIRASTGGLFFADQTNGNNPLFFDPSGNGTLIGLATFTHAPTSSIAGTILVSDVNNPIIGFQVTGAPSNQKVWDIVTTSTQMVFRTANDAGAGNVSWLSVTRSGTAITGLQMWDIVSLGTNTLQTVATTSTATAVFTVGSCTTSPTTTITFYKVGNTVTASIPQITNCTATGSPVGFILTGTYPAGYQPLTNQVAGSFLTNNGVGQAGFVNIQSGRFQWALPNGGALTGAINYGNSAVFGGDMLVTYTLH